MKSYIGFTGMSLARRFRKHQSDARKGQGWILHAAMRKHGVDSFMPSPLVTVANRAEAVVYERLFIREFKTRSPFGYNMTDGGDGATGYRHTEKWKRELSRRGKGRKVAADQLVAMRQRMLGWTPTDQTRLNMRLAQLGRRHSSETIQRMRESAVRRWQTNPIEFSEEHKARLRIMNLGVKFTSVHRDRIRAALTGKPKSAAHKAALTKAAQAREARKRKAKTLADDVQKTSPDDLRPVRWYAPGAEPERRTRTMSDQPNQEPQSEPPVNPAEAPPAQPEPQPEPAKEA